MKLYAFPEATINEVLTYLGTKPASESMDLIQTLQKEAKLVTNSDGTPLELPETLAPPVEGFAGEITPTSNGHDQAKSAAV